LILGIISAVLSISWMIQLILEVFLQGLLGPYLSDIFQKLTAAFPLFGVVAYGIFAFYLLACVVKGIPPQPSNLQK
jgi:LMBR1 domain-containing protein 1